jgi:hypothetical protein
MFDFVPRTVVLGYFQTSHRDCFWNHGAKAIVGLRPSFSAHVRLGERGAPVDSLCGCYDITLLFNLQISTCPSK